MFPLSVSLLYMLTNMLSTKEGLLYFTILVGLVIHGCKIYEDIVLRNSFIYSLCSCFKRLWLKSPQIIMFIYFFNLVESYF